MSDESSVENLFFAALEKGSVAQRADFLDTACGEDAELRRQVEKLLRAHPKVGVFLQKPAAEQFATALTLPDAASAIDTAADVKQSDNGLGFLQPSVRPDGLGRIGHYEILEILGQGGFGVVLRAIDETLQREVAVKVLSPYWSASPLARQRFLDEARASAKIRHENVVQVYAVYEQTQPYLVMELIPGESVQQRLSRTGCFDSAEVARIGRQIAEGLAASHAIGLIHRDIKPDNILLDSGSADQPRESRVKITDFGLARAGDDASMIQYGIVAGTPMFMAPEQAAGEALDHRADLFSLGSVLYCMCCGRPPFQGKNTYAVLRQVVEETPQPIQEISPDTPTWLCEIITRLHAKRPEDRFASAQEVADLFGIHLAQIQEPPISIDALPTREKSISVNEPAETTPKIRVRSRKFYRPWHRWATASSVLLLILCGGLGFTEATDVTDFRGTIIRLFSPEGTLVIEIDDPGVSVQIDGMDLVITGAGAKEIRLKPGKYVVESRKDGNLLSRELVSVTNNGRHVVRVRQESPAPKSSAANRPLDVTSWERSVAAMPANERIKAVAARLKQLNPGFDGAYEHASFNHDMVIRSPDVRDLSPLRALPQLQSLVVHAQKLTDLSALEGIALTRLALNCLRVTDLSPLQGMNLTELNLSGSSGIADLSPLKGMPLESLTIHRTQVSDLSPLAGMKLKHFNCDSTNVADLSPLKGMPLTKLIIHRTKITDLSPLAGMPLTNLHCNNTPVTDACIVHIRACNNLTLLSLIGTKVTSAGFDELKKTLPNCEIRWDGGETEPQ